jgi:microcystin-dependent protein
MTGNITFNGAQTFSVSGIQDATTLQKGVVQVGSNLNVSSGIIYALSADTTQAGVVQLTNVNNSCSCSLAPTANVLRLTWDEASLAKTTADAALTVANDALPRAGGAMTGSITFAGGQTFPVSGIQDATTGQKGIVQIGTNINVASGTISVLSSSTTQPGVVQLEDSTSSTSTALALTANQGKLLQDQIDALTNSGGTILAGTIDASTGLMQTVTSNGASKGFVVGQVMPNASNGNKNYYTIATVAGTMTPPGGSSTQVDVGDWWLSVTNGAAHTWDLLQVGYHAPDATTTTAGVVCLSTNALAQAGVDTTTAVTPSALQSKISDSVATNSCITIASSTAAKCAYDVAIAAIPNSAFAAKGNLLAGTASCAYCALPIGTNSYVLSANSACAAGMEWIANTGGVSSLTVCPTLCNLGTSTNPILCAVPAPAPIGICPGTGYGVVKLVNDVCNNCTCLAASAYAVNNAYIVASCALPKSGGTITGGVTFGCNGLGCPAYIAFSNGIANGCIYGISDILSAGESNVAASSYALSTVYTIANAALPTSGGTMSSSISFSAGGICFTPTTSCITGLTSALNSTSTTLALTAAGGCCLNFIASCKLSTSGGLLTGGITFLTGAGGICFTDSSSCFLGITNSISCTSSTLAASATAVKCAYDTGAAAIPCSAFAAKGNVLVGTASGTYSALSVGTNGQVLTACSTCASGVAWVSSGSGSGTVTSITAGTGLTGGTITTSGTIALDTTCVVQPTAYTAKGTILSASAASTPSALAVGSNGCTLIANSACTTGLCWGPGSIPCSTVTAKGDLIAGTAANTFSALPVGTDGLFLTANSASATGLCWAQVGDSPVGAISFFAMCTAPTGWLVADGSCVSRSTYSALFTAVGTTYGAGDGTTTFQLPNLRGRFARGWNSTASGCDPSRAFGSCQAQALCCHNHGITMCPGSAGVPEWAIKDATTCVRGYPQCGGPASPTNYQRGFSDCVGGSATETRPDNIALLPCIKVGISVALDVNATPTVAGAVVGCTNNLCHNTMIGCSAGAAVTTAACLTAVGKNSLCLATGGGNTAIGSGAGSAVTTGINNVIIGLNTAVASPTGSCQLALGFSATDNWLTGTSTKAIKPGAGIIDCANSCGTAGQFLMSNGANAVCWGSSAGVGSWTSAGTIQSVGLGATTTAPTVNATSKNNVSYRQIGAKDWEVVYTLTATAQLTAGSGDYLFTLPNSLSFDTTLQWQPIYTGSVGAAATVNRLYFLPGPSCSQIIFTNGNTGSAYGAAPVIYDATRFRFFATADADPAPRAVGSSWYVGTASLLAFVIRFQFTST